MSYGSLIGRAPLIAHLNQLFGQHRFVTLLGPGGVGKTRLIQEWNAQRQAPAALCDLSDVTTMAELEHVIGLAFGIELIESNTRAALVAGLSAREHPFLILDNAESLIQATRDLLDALLTEVPALRVCVTSREALGARGETSCPVGPLSTSDGIALFTQAAARQNSRFALLESERAQVVEVVELLDGLPLALELVAARTKLLTIQQLCERLRVATLDVATDRSSGRHQSLRRVVEDSWALIDTTQQNALALCSVFPGWFELEAARAVIGGDADASATQLEALVDRSLVATAPSNGKMKLRLFAAVRELTLEHLKANGQGAAASFRHARYYLDRAQAAQSLSFSRRFALLREDLDHLLSVVRNHHGHAPELVAEAALALHPFLLQHGPPTLHEQVIEAALLACTNIDQRLELSLARIDCLLLIGETFAALTAIDKASGEATAASKDGMLGRIMAQKARALVDYGRYEEGAQTWRDALPQLRQGGDAVSLVSSLCHLGYITGAAEPLLESLALAREAGLVREHSMSLCCLGVLQSELGNTEQVRPLLLQAEAGAREAGDLRNLGLTLTHMGTAFILIGDLDAASRALDEALALNRMLGNRLYHSMTQNYRAFVALQRKQIAEHAEELRAVVATSQALGNIWTGSNAAGLLAVALAASGNDADAEQMLATARTLGAPMSHVHHLMLDCLAATVGLIRASRLPARGDKTALVQAAAQTLRSVHLPHAEARRTLGRTVDLWAVVAGLRAYLPANEHNLVTIRLAYDANKGTFALPNGTIIDLSRRPVLRNIMALLVAARRHAPGIAVPANQLIEHIWPDVRTKEVLHNRMYNALAKLRDAGFDDVVANRDQGYLIDPRYIIEDSTVGL